MPWPKLSRQKGILVNENNMAVTLCIDEGVLLLQRNVLWVWQDSYCWQMKNEIFDKSMSSIKYQVFSKLMLWGLSKKVDSLTDIMVCITDNVGFLWAYFIHCDLKTSSKPAKTLHYRHINIVLLLLFLKYIDPQCYCQVIFIYPSSPSALTNLLKWLNTWREICCKYFRYI